MPIRTLGVLITSFNRRTYTLAALDSLFRQQGIEDVQLKVFLVDDGCTDGTGEAVRASFPQVTVLQGTGKLFWDGGMRMAFAAATTQGFDAYMFFNDDTSLYPDAAAQLIAVANRYLELGKPAIVTGSTRSPVHGFRTYGGIQKRVRGIRFQLAPIDPDSSEPKACDTMNGNFVIIPKEIVHVCGNIEAGFTQQFGDFDYGLRATRAGFQVVMAPGYSGECKSNSREGTWRDASASFAKRWKYLMSPKGVPVKDWLIFTSRHFGWRWPLYFAAPYAKTILMPLLPKREREKLLQEFPQSSL